MTTKEQRAQRVAYMRRYREKNRKKLRPIRQAESRRYWLENKETILAKRKQKPRTEQARVLGRAHSKAWRERNPEKAKEVARRYGLKNPARSWKRTQRLQEAMAGRPRPKTCEVCDGKRGRIAFDHCHKSGAFRGWICGDCNLVLGLVNDDPDRLRKLILYLER
jgi:hypothetical protein